MTYIITFILAIFSGILRGFVLSKLWLWFVVWTFGVIPLGVVQAIGLSLIVGFLTHQPDYYDDKELDGSEKAIRSVFVAILWPTFALLSGWILKQWL